MNCCACSGKSVAIVHDGWHRKPVCEVHARLYRERGYTIERGYLVKEEK